MLLNLLSANVFALDENLTDTFDHHFYLLAILNIGVRAPIFGSLPP